MTQTTYELGEDRRPPCGCDSDALELVNRIYMLSLFPKDVRKLLLDVVAFVKLVRERDGIERGLELARVASLPTELE